LGIGHRSKAALALGLTRTRERTDCHRALLEVVRLVEAMPAMRGG
jgi:hypothetical protein